MLPPRRVVGFSGPAAHIALIGASHPAAEAGDVVDDLFSPTISNRTRLRMSSDALSDLSRTVRGGSWPPSYSSARSASHHRGRGRCVRGGSYREPPAVRPWVQSPRDGRQSMWELGEAVPGVPLSSLASRRFQPLRVNELAWCVLGAHPSPLVSALPVALPGSAIS